MRPAAQLAQSPDESTAWLCLRALARRASQGNAMLQARGVWVDSNGHLRESEPDRGWIVARPDLRSGWSPGPRSRRELHPRAAQLLDLFMPLCVGPRSDKLIVAHLGQSADGHVATFSGTSKFITGAEDIQHTHRMRALFDAVLVGANTVAIDDPLLTTRLVPGRSPVRVVLDPRSRLKDHHQVFCDRAQRTLVVSVHLGFAQLPPRVERALVKCDGDCFDIPLLVEQLRLRGLHRIFIEGGEITVSRFLQAQALDRLQIAVAPVKLGPGPRAVPKHLQPSAVARLGPTRRFTLGDDTLFEAALHSRV